MEQMYYLIIIIIINNKNTNNNDDDYVLAVVYHTRLFYRCIYNKRFQVLNMIISQQIHATHL